MCDKNTYIQYLKGCGTPCPNTNLCIIKNDQTRKSTEARALDKIAPPSRLNPNYQNPKIPKVGKVKADKAGVPTVIDSKILQRLLYG